MTDLDYLLRCANGEIEADPDTVRTMRALLARGELPADIAEALAEGDRRHPERVPLTQPPETASWELGPDGQPIDPEPETMAAWDRLSTPPDQATPAASASNARRRCSWTPSACPGSVSGAASPVASRPSSSNRRSRRVGMGEAH